MISRKGATADVKRSPKGGTVWTIERPENPWSIETGSFEGYRDDELLMIDGIFVCLALIPRDGERGVIIGVRDGELCIDSLGA